MNKYEITVLIHPDLEPDLEKVSTKVEKIMEGAGATNVAKDVWGKKKLAYKIAKQDYAVYVHYSVEMPGEGVKKVNDTLNITDEVVRFLIVKVDERALEKAANLRAEKAAKNAGRTDDHNDDDKDNDEE